MAQAITNPHFPFTEQREARPLMIPADSNICRDCPYSDMHSTQRLFYCFLYDLNHTSKTHPIFDFTTNSQNAVPSMPSEATAKTIVCSSSERWTNCSSVDCANSFCVRFPVTVSPLSLLGNGGITTSFPALRFAQYPGGGVGISRDLHILWIATCGSQHLSSLPILRYSAGPAFLRVRSYINPIPMQPQ